MSPSFGDKSLPNNPVEKAPRRRIDVAAIVIGIMIALTPEPSNAVLVGVLSGVVLLTVKWAVRRWSPRDLTDQEP